MQKKELTDLVASLVVLTIAFSYPSLNPITLGIYALAVGTGFLLHELAHKYTAQHFGYYARYVASPNGLLFAIGLSIVTGGSFVFAAPGAVMIQSKQSLYDPVSGKYWDMVKQSKEFGYMALSGPLTNLILAAIFYTLAISTPSPILMTLGRFGAFVNVFLAGFNMLPFGPLDGAKVMRHMPMMWAAVGLPSILLAFFMIKP